MDFEYSPRVKELQKRLIAFMDEHIYPNESKYYTHVRGDKRWEAVPIIEELKPKAGKDRFVSDLLDFLEVHSIVKLEEAAQAIRVPPELLADYARHHPVQFGYLAGPPAVLLRAVPGWAGDPGEEE